MAIVAWLASAAAAEEPRAEAELAPTYLVTQLLPNERLLLRKVLLRNVKTGKDVKVNVSAEPAVIEVEPGLYYLRRVDTAYFNLSSMRIAEPAQKYELQPGHANYIGDLHIALVDKPKRHLSWQFLLNAQTLAAAAARHADAFRRASPLLLVLGAEPVAIDLAGLPAPSD
jgi:hypothetical protein